MKTCVIGIDGGGTKTQAVLLDREGREIGRGRAGGSNPNSAGPDAAAAALREVVWAALRAPTPPVALDQVAAIGVGVAGTVAWQGWLHDTLSQAAPGVRVVAGKHDAEIALIGGLGKQRGIVVIAGTGSTAYGMNDAGEEAFVGGWGYMLGDEGSGFIIGRAAMRRFLYAVDGRAQPCPLSEAVAAYVGATTFQEIAAWAYGGGPQVRKVADLAPLVMQLAAQGDPDARAIIDEAADELALHVRAISTRLAMPRCEVALVGGALRWEGELARTVVRRLARDLPGVTPVAPRADAATGAAWLAMRALGWRTL